MENSVFREELRLATSSLLAAASLLDACKLNEARKAVEDARSHCTALLSELDARNPQSASPKSP
jgi:hypothetical protein